MNLADAASFAVAALDLALVHDLVGAIRAADAYGAAHAGSATSSPAAIYEPRQHIHPEPRYEDRQIVHPEPRYAPRPIVHLSPRFELPRLALTAPTDFVERSEAPHKSPIQPPWALMPWHEPAKPPMRVKVIHHHTDIVTKGTLIDMFM